MTKSLRAGIVAVALLSTVSNSANAALMVAGSGTVGLNGTLSVQGFDPKLGTLTRVFYVQSATVSVTWSGMEEHDVAQSPFLFPRVKSTISTSSGELLAENGIPGFEGLLALPYPEIIFTPLNTSVPVYDPFGNIDHYQMVGSGTYTFNTTSLGGELPWSASAVSPLISYFINPGMVDLKLEVQNLSDMGGTSTLRYAKVTTDDSSSVNLTVEYDYIPTSVPEPSTFFAGMFLLVPVGTTILKKVRKS